MAKKEFLQSQQILKRCFNNVTGKLKSNGGTYTTQDYLNAVYDQSKDSLRIVVQGGGNGGTGGNGVSYWGSLVYDESQLPQKQKQGTITPVIKNDTLSFYYYDGTQWSLLLQSTPTYDDTQIRGLIQNESEERKTALQQITSGVEELSEQIDKLKKITDIEEYTAVEVFPHNFSIRETGGSVKDGLAKTVGEMFTQWQELGTKTAKYVQTSNVGNLNDAYSYRVSGKVYYKRFHPTKGYIDVELQELTELPEVGQLNVLYQVGDKYYFYYDEQIRNLRKHLTTAKDSDVFLKFGSGYEIMIKLRTRLTEEQVKSGKSNVVLDWGDGIQTLFKDGVKSGNNYEFHHIYEKQFWNKNLILKVYGNDYYMMQFGEKYSNSQTTQVIVTRAMDYDLPVAKHLKIFANFMQNNMVYRVDARRCNHSFEGCNIARMFTTKMIQEVIGFNDDANEMAFNSIYCMNYMFNGVITLKNIDFKFPSMCKLPYYQYVFNGVYFNYGGEPYDILKLFNNFSFSLMPENEPVDVAGMFNNCKNITCTDYQKLGSYLWNNINVNWKNTSGVFKGCPEELRANIPVEWGGLLQGWKKPIKSSLSEEQKQFVDWGVENKNTLEYFVTNKQKIEKLLSEQFAVKTFVMTLPKIQETNLQNITAVNIDINGVIKNIVDEDNFDGDITTHYRIDVQGYVVGIQTYQSSESILSDRYYTKQVYEESNGSGMTHIYLTKQEYEYFSNLQNGKNVMKIHYLNMTIGNGTLLRKTQSYVPGAIQVGVKIIDGEIIQTDIQSQITHYRYRINGYVMSVESYPSNEAEQADQVIPYSTSYIEDQNGGVGYTDIYFTKQGWKQISQLESPKNVIEFYYLYQVS